MLVELILWYLLQSNFPIFPDPKDRLCIVAGPNCLKAKMAVRVNKEWSNGIYIDLKPYVAVNEKLVALNAGGEAEVGYNFGPVKFGLYHHSTHALDSEGTAIQSNGFTLTWRLD